VARRVAAEALVDLRRRLDRLAPRDPERGRLMAATAGLYGVSRATLYRQLRETLRPRPAHRADRGRPRAMPAAALERYCELVAALKLRSENRKGRRLSTVRAIELLERHGVETPEGLVQAPGGRLKRATVDRYLALWGLDHDRLTRPPPAVRFEARHANALWQLDLSPSDLKQVEAPSWVEPGRGAPTLMLYSVVDDRSGVCYQEYRCVYGEDVEAALRFLFAAMSPKAETSLGLEGIPEALYLDNGPIGKSRVFRSVMDQLGIQVMPHLPAGSDGRRPTARAKGKVERAFRTVKDVSRSDASRDPLSLPQAGLRGGGEPMAAALPGAVQRAAAPRRRPVAPRGLARQPARGRLARDVQLGAVLRLPRAGTAQGRQRRQGHRRGCPLRARPRAGRRDGGALVGAVRPRSPCRAR
jgi:hypothetical protein